MFLIDGGLLIHAPSSLSIRLPKGWHQAKVNYAFPASRHGIHYMGHDCGEPWTSGSVQSVADQGRPFN